MPKGYLPPRHIIDGQANALDELIGVNLTVSIRTAQSPEIREDYTDNSGWFGPAANFR